MRICVQFLVMTKERRIEKRQEEVRENDSRNCMTVSSFFIRVYILKKIYLASIFFSSSSSLYLSFLRYV